VRLPHESAQIAIILIVLHRYLCKRFFCPYPSKGAVIDWCQGKSRANRPQPYERDGTYELFCQ